MTILSKGCKPDDLELHNSLRPSFTNIKGLSSNFVDCESFLESKSLDIFALFETNLDGSIETVRGCLSLMDSTTHMHGLTVFVKEGLPFAWDRSLENSADSYFQLFLTGLTSLSVLLRFLYQSPSFSLCMFFDSVSCNIDGVLSINASADVFVFGDFNNHHKDWSAYSGGMMVPRLLGSQAVILTVLLFWICFFLLMLVVVLQWLSLHWEILIMVLSKFPSTFHQILNRMPYFIT